MNRREFAALAPALLSIASLAEAQPPQTTGVPPKSGSIPGPLPTLVSGVYPPGPPHGTERVGRTFLNGMLQAGNIQMQIHETTQEAGTAHEPVGKHLHSEIWLVREGICELTTNGITRRMVAGEVGLCCAGDLHYIRNAGDTKCTYFVVTVGPPELRA
jgi:hypothetical protein